MTNPLLELNGLPEFSRIEPGHVRPAVEQLLAEGRQQVEDLLAANTTYTWDNLVAPMEAMDDRINRAWSPVSHMNSVVNTDELRDAYNACLPLLSEYGTEPPRWGYAAHPLVRGESVYHIVGGKGSIAVAFDKKTGE